MRLAYLCNLYPAVSHSFVRREIEAIENAGHEVGRFSLRPARADLKDEADLREERITEAVLGKGVVRLVRSSFALIVSSPVKSAESLGMAYRLSGPGFRSKIRHFAYWLEAAWLLRRLRQLNVEHLHAHFGTNPAAVAAIVHAWGGPPFSFTVHGPDEFDAPVALALQQKIAAAKFVAGISSYGRSQLMRWSSFADWDKIKLVRCGVDGGYLDVDPDPSPVGSTEFVCVARLSSQKGLPLLVGACQRLRDDGQQFTVTIIGDGELRDALEADIRRRGLEQSVRLVGICSASEIRAHLRRARAFVLPSFAEGLPVVIMEALAQARPVIATAVAGIPELVDGECGWLVPAGSEDALVEAMTDALRCSAEDLAKKGAVGRGRVMEMHCSITNAKELLELIAEPL